MTRTKFFSLFLLILLVGTFSGCHKTCHCVKYDGTIDNFPAEEVKAQGKTCSEMRIIDGLATTYYTFCDWNL